MNADMIGRRAFLQLSLAALVGLALQPALRACGQAEPPPAVLPFRLGEAALGAGPAALTPARYVRLPLVTR